MRIKRYVMCRKGIVPNPQWVLNKQHLNRALQSRRELHCIKITWESGGWALLTQGVFLSEGRSRGSASESCLSPGGRFGDPGLSQRGTKGPFASDRQQQGPDLTSLGRGWALGHQQKRPDNELPHYLADCHSPQPPSAISPVTWHVPILPPAGRGESMLP